MGVMSGLGARWGVWGFWKRFFWVLGGMILGVVVVWWLIREGRFMVFEAEAMRARSEMEKVLKWKRVYYGRMSIEVPYTESDAATHGGEQHLGDAWVKRLGIEPAYLHATIEDVEEWPHGRLGRLISQNPSSALTDGQTAYDAMWLKERERLEKDGLAKVVFFEQVGPEAWMHISFRESGSLDLNALVYALVNSSYVVKIRAGSMVGLDDSKEGFEDGRYDMREALTRLRRAVPDVVGRLRLTSEVLGSGQSLREVLFHGEVALVEQPFDQKEDSGGGFGYPRIWGEKGSMGFRMEYAPDKPISLLAPSTLIENQSVARLYDVEITDLRVTKRHAVDGMEGEEYVSLIRDKKGELYTYSWFERLEESRRSRVEVELTHEGDADRGRATALWDHVLESMKWHGPPRASAMLQGGKR